MVQVETALGYGFHVSRDQAKDVKYIEDMFVLRPMCQTCGQSPYFFGMVIKTINSKQAYIEFDLQNNTIELLHDNIKGMLEVAYEELFGRKPPFDPKFMMFTDLKVV